MKRILAQARKELAQLQRDRLTLALAIVLPILTLFIFGFAIRLESKDIPIALQDLDNSPHSRAYIEQLFATNQFKPVPTASQIHPESALDQGIARAVIIIPPDFEKALNRQYPVSLQVLIDGTDANNARFVQNAIRATTNAYLRSSGLLARPPTIEPQVRLWFNPGRKESLYIVPGVFGVILWIYPSLLAAIAMVREKERGTIVQVYASSLSAEELLLGKGLAYLIVGIAQAVGVITLGALIFRLHFAGEPSSFLVGTLIFLAAAVMFGQFVGVRANSQNAAVQGVATIGFLTALLLSGFIYPLGNIPFPLSLISNIVPARYYIALSRDAFVRGTGWSGVWWMVLMIALIGFLLFNVARKLLSRMQLPG
ncbi:MAG TPA: ABC transporter permease [Leptolyngbyaceae cyanobacterium]